MSPEYDRNLLLGLPRRIFFTTDFITYILVVPLTSILSYLLIDISTIQTIIYFSVILGLIGISLTVTIISYRKIYLPIMRYFKSVLEGREISDSDFSLAKLTFYNISHKRAREAFFSWCALMPVGITMVVLFFNPTLKAIVLIVSLFFIDIMSMTSLYYLAIEYHTRQIARTGIFSRMAEGDQKIKTRMSTSLSLVIIAMVAVFYGLMVAIAFNIVNNSLYSDRIAQMKTAASLISGRSAGIFETYGDDKPLLKSKLEQALAEVRDNGRYAIVIDGEGTVLSHPNEAMISRKASKFDWGRRMASTKNDCFEFLDETDDKPMIACTSYNNDFQLNIGYVSPRSEIDTTGGNMALFMLIFATSCLLIIGFGVYKLVAYRLEPIEECSTVIRETGRGNLHQDVISYSTDEPGGILLTMKGFLAELRSIVSNTQEVSSDLASASVEMAVTAESFSANAQNQASTAEEVTATAEEVSASVDKIATDAKEQYEGITLLLTQIRDLDTSINKTAAMLRETADISTQISQKAREGEQSLTGMNSAMTRIIQSSEEMTGIVKIINDISEQINLLSLNAAIEAARAGDAGRGFAVVADEISKLADQTATSIKDIDRLIKTNTEQIQSGMTYIGNTTRNIGAIIEGVTTITSRMGALTENIKQQVAIKDSVNSEGDAAQARSDQIRIATDEQKRAMEEIVKSITRINELTQSIAAGTEEMTASLKGIERMAETLKESIAYFKT
ncbi:MAG: hypothetical protein JXA07_02130 [Spirochaetes bacterium]|nr:hypothetical protein [Spirochaetota bacterium]